jgi:hypothetical protein
MELEELASCDIRCEVSKMDRILISVVVVNYGFERRQERYVCGLIMSSGICAAELSRDDV